VTRLDFYIYSSYESNLNKVKLTTIKSQNLWRNLLCVAVVVFTHSTKTEYISRYLKMVKQIKIELN